MNILIDENFPKKSGDFLQSKGFNVIDIRGTDKEGISDIEIFKIAKKEKAVLLTTDKDFYHTIHFTNKPHNGIIVIALSQPNSRKIIEKLEWFLRIYSKNTFKNKCFLITENKCRIFS